MYVSVAIPIPMRSDYDIAVDADPGVALDQIEERAYRAALHHRSRFGLGGVGNTDAVRTGDGARWREPLAPPDVAAAVHRGIDRART